jgi:hypothetical protein
MAAKVNNPLFNPLFFFQKNLQKEIQLNIETATKELNASTKENRQKTTTITIPVATSTLKSLAISSSENLSTKEPTSLYY